MRKVKLIATIMSLTMALGLMSFATYAAVNITDPVVTGSIDINTTISAISFVDAYATAAADGEEYGLGALSVTVGDELKLWYEFETDEKISDKYNIVLQAVSSSLGILTTKVYDADGSDEADLSSDHTYKFEAGTEQGETIRVCVGITGTEATVVSTAFALTFEFITVPV